MKILPAATPLTQPYWDGTRADTLLLQHCRACGERWHPPMPRCPACYSPDVDWQPAGGGGIVYTYTVVRHATHPAFQDRVPYVVAVVELDEGPRIVTSVGGCPVEDVHAGMRVALEFDHVTDEVSLPRAMRA